jgi:hypothetical protein
MIYTLYRAKMHFIKHVRPFRSVHEPIGHFALAHVNRQIRGELLAVYAQDFSIRLRLEDASLYARHFFKPMHDIARVVGTITINVAYREGDVFGLLKFCKKHRDVSVRLVTTEEVRVQLTHAQPPLRYLIFPEHATHLYYSPMQYHSIIPRQTPSQDTPLPDLQDVIDKLIAAPTNLGERRWSIYFDNAVKELIVLPSIGPRYGPQPYVHVRMIVKPAEKAWWLFAATEERRVEVARWQERTGCPVVYALRLE